jgi:hypothetical protein
MEVGCACSSTPATRLRTSLAPYQCMQAPLTRPIFDGLQQLRLLYASLVMRLACDSARIPLSSERRSPICACHAASVETGSVSPGLVPGRTWLTEGVVAHWTFVFQLLLGCTCLMRGRTIHDCRECSCMPVHVIIRALVGRGREVKYRRAKCRDVCEAPK